jgi:predicted metal-dependent peptidase
MTAAMPKQAFTQNDCDKAMSKAKIELMGSDDCTFFIHCVLTLIHIWDDTMPTAWTDGVHVGYNRAFFMTCSEEERVGLILHETLHVVFMHMLRLMGFDPKKWNRACDYVINLIIISRGFKLPKGGLYDTQYRDMFAEQVYALLPQVKADRLRRRKTKPCRARSMTCW